MRYDNRRARRLIGASAFPVVLLAAACSLGTLDASASDTHGARAKDAKTISLNESGSLHLTSKQGFTLNEQGSASGTVKGTIYVHLRIVSSRRVTVELNVYSRGASITAFGRASYHREHTQARFSGSMSLERGSGSYAHARGSGLRFNGTIQRSDDSITVHVAGRAVD